MLLSGAIQQWLKYVLNHCAKNTYINYRRELYALADYLPAGIEVENVTIEALENFINQLSVGCSTKNISVIAIKSFFRWCLDYHEIPNISTKLKKFKVIHRQRFLSEQEYEKVLTVCNPRERAIIEFLANSGLRCTAFLSLDRSNIRGNMLYVACKGRARVIPLNETAKNSLNTLLSGNMNLSKSLKLTRSGVYQVCCRVAKRVGMERFGPHSLRRLFANRLRRHGTDIFVISRILGHASISTTMVYFGLSGDELAGVTDFMVKPTSDD
jgi:site-specific recombinase XerD